MEKTEIKEEKVELKKEEKENIAEKVDEKETEKESKEEYKEIKELTREERIEERLEQARKERLAVWKPKTKLGKLIKEGKIKDIDEIFEKGDKIEEAEIVDSLVHLSYALVKIGQSKGKFGGGKRREWRQTQRKSAEGNIRNFGALAIVGDLAGHVGVGYGKAKETVPAREKAARYAKLNLVKIKRSCGSFDCGCKEEHSIAFAAEGKVGSVVVRIMPAPKGTGLVCDDECKKLFRLAGIKDIYTKSFGQTRTKINMINATLAALKKVSAI